jgi:DtxR family transcriptional regulator, Mn-dependent transcriptional regulator
MSVTPKTPPVPISSPLEDYLETIYLLVQEHGFARVRDIARARDVKAATVSVALRKLADAGLADYERREYTRLTPKGERAARRILTRHRLLTRFFEEVLRMAPAAAGAQACAMEHVLTDEAADRMVRFFEFLGRCPSVADTFRRCPLGVSAADGALPEPSDECRRCGARAEEEWASVADLKPGQSGVVAQISASGAVRQRLLDMGLLPETEIGLERLGPGGDPLWIRCQGARLALRRSEAARIRIRRNGDA